MGTNTTGAEQELGRKISPALCTSEELTQRMPRQLPPSAHSKRTEMITRIWHGWTLPENADTYEDLLRTEILPGIAQKQIPGYRGVHLLRRELADEVEFVTMMWFDSIDSVREFMGEDYEVAYVPESARKVLARFDERSQHYDMRLTPEQTA